MPRKLPTRQTNEITQQYNSGYVDIYEVQDEAEPGYQPLPKLTHKARLRYEEQRLGINRLYLSRQNQAEIVRVIRTNRHKRFSTQDVAVTEDGMQYRIDTVQIVPDVFPPSVNISLRRIDQDYDLANNENVEGKGA